MSMRSPAETVEQLAFLNKLQKPLLLLHWSWDITVSNSIEATCSMSQGLNPGESKRFLSSAICPDWVSVTHPASYSIGTRLRCTAGHSPPCRAKAKYELSYTSTLPMSSWCGQGQLQQLQWFQNVPDVHQCRIWTRMTGSCMRRTFVALLGKWPPYWKMCTGILARYYNRDKYQSQRWWKHIRVSIPE
jgi:hypothetical protein